MSTNQFPDDLMQALLALSEWLRAEAIPHTTIGGVAVSFVAQPRLTQDIDAVIWLDESLWESLLRSGKKHGIVPRISDALSFVRTSRVLLLKHEPTEVSIDLSCGALPFEQEMIERAVTLRIGRLTLKVPTPEDLIITKAVAHRPKDLADLVSIISMTKKLDQERIRYWVGQFADVLEMPEIAESVQALLQKKNPVRPSGRKRSAKRRKK